MIIEIVAKAPLLPEGLSISTKAKRAHAVRVAHDLLNLADQINEPTLTPARKLELAQNFRDKR